MKFRYKVLFVNLIILSVVLGFTGYLLVYRNYRQAMELELRNWNNAERLSESMLIGFLRRTESR